MSMQFQKECEYCGDYAWCGVLGDRWHCGCLTREEDPQTTDENDSEE